MMSLDERLGSAVEDLRDEVGYVDVPPFKPRRSAAPAVLAVLLLVGIGIAGLATRSGSETSGDISVATQPEVVTEPQQTEVSPSEPEDDEADEDDVATDLVSGSAVPAFGESLAVTAASVGEFFMPVPQAPVWSSDSRRIILYGTGAADPGHLVVDPFSPDATPIVVPFTPPDIEQIYWHPTEPDLLLYAAESNLVGFDLNSKTSTVLHTFEGCDRVDSGKLPVPPAPDGTVSLLCHQGEAAATNVTYNLSTGVERRAATTSDAAAVPSISGDRLLQWNADGSASVLDRELVETGVVLELGNNGFGFLVDSDGREWIAATLFDGPVVGTVVLLPLDGGEATVLIGPDRGDAYPPTGTLISTSGDKIAVSIRGEDDGVLTGRVTVLDLSESFTEPERTSIAHRSGGLHDYWSNPFISVNAQGLVAYSTDGGGDAVNTFVTNLGADGAEPN